MIYMEHPSKKRYYLLYATQDLFEAWSLVTAFGSTVTHHGRIVIQVHPNRESALLALFDIETKKRQHGYIYSDLIHAELFHLRPQTIQEVLSAKSTNYIPSNNYSTDLRESKEHYPIMHPNQQELFA